MSSGHWISDRRRARSGSIALGIIGAHAGLIALLLRNVLTVPSIPATPIVVSVVKPNETQPQAAKLAPPELSRVHALLIPPAEFEVTSDSPSAVTAAVAETASREPVSPASATQAVVQELPAMSEVAYLRQPVPHYPPQSRRAREEGLVVLRVTIDSAGRVVNVDIQRSSGHPRLDEAARDAVSQALFKPYMDGGVPRSAAAIIPIEFSLHVSSG